MQTQTTSIARYPRLLTITSFPDKASSLQTAKHKVEYSEYQAFGKPHHHLGVIGDVYVDLTKGNHALYGKVEDGWRRWPGPSQRTASVPHPNYPSHVLWCKVESKLLGWVSKKTITGRILVSSASQVIALILSYRLSLHQKQLKKANCAGGHVNKRPRLSDASNSLDIALQPSSTAADRTATDVSFSVPPAPNAVPEFIDRCSIPDYHPPQIAESKTQTQTGTAVTKRKVSRHSIIANPNQIVQAPADCSDLDAIGEFLLTMVNGANGSRGACPTSNIVSVPCQPPEFSHPHAVVTNSPKKSCPLASSSESGRKRKWEPEPEPLSDCEPDPDVESKHDVEQGNQAVAGPDRLFTPSPSPIIDSNQDHTHIFTPELSPELDSNQNLGTGPDLTHIFTPSPSPKPEFKKELEARASSQPPAHLRFSPSPSPKPASELPGPDLAHIFTPIASPSRVPSPEPEPSPPRRVTHATSAKPIPSIKPSPASSSTLSGTGSCDRSNSSRSVSKSVSASASKSGTKRDKRSDVPLSQCSRSPGKSSNMLKKTPKTPRTPEKRSSKVPVDDSDSDEIVLTHFKLATGKRRIPAVTLSPTKLKLKERKWNTQNPSPSSSSHAESSLGLKVMPRMRDRRPSDVVKRTATIDRKPLKAKFSNVIDLTMESDEEEDEEERERKNVRPLLLCRAALKKEPGDDGGGDEEEMGVADCGDPMVEDDAWGDAGEAATDEREGRAPLQDVPSAGVMAVEDDKMVEDPPEEEPACEPEQPSSPHPAPGPPLVEDGMESLPVVATVDESAHQTDTDSDTETLDGDVEMGDTTMIGQDDDDKTIDDDEEVDELDPDSDLLDLGGGEEDDRWSDFHLDLIFGSERIPYERHCRFCLGQKEQLWLVRIQEDPQARWSLTRRKAIRHCTSNHWPDYESVLCKGTNELQEIAKQLSEKFANH